MTWKTKRAGSMTWTRKRLNMIDLPLPRDVLLCPELTSLCTLQTALEMSAYALYLSYPEITEGEQRSPDPDLLAAATMLRSIRSLQRDLHAYRQVLEVYWLDA